MSLIEKYGELKINTNGYYETANGQLLHHLVFYVEGKNIKKKHYHIHQRALARKQKQEILKNNERSVKNLQGATWNT